jgi:hypothetical protein
VMSSCAQPYYRRTLGPFFTIIGAGVTPPELAPNSMFDMIITHVTLPLVWYLRV